jgi:hypothetical protein
MTTTTFSVRVGRSTKSRLEKLAKSTGRSRSFLAAEAISAYLDTNEWQVAGITTGLFSGVFPCFLNVGIIKSMSDCYFHFLPSNWVKTG